MLDPSVYASTIYIPHLKKVVPILYVQGGPKKKIMMWSRGKVFEKF